MPALLELQRSMREQLLGGKPPQDELLGIYRNTMLSTLVTALQLSFPAVRRIVGDDFFEASAREFIGSNAPDSACLNDYGEQFPEFLVRFAPAATLAYLPDVARLEWAVNRALHAPDCTILDLRQLSTLGESALAGVSFRVHPSLTLLRLQFPADVIWRAVLEQDSEAMAGVDLRAGPVHLLIERNADGVQVRSLAPSAWQFTQRLVAGVPLYIAFGELPQPHEHINVLLADHLAAGRFIDFASTGVSPS
jgi:hypothetical protein